MIKKRCLTAEWIDQKAGELHFADKLRIEKAIRAFFLLSMLSDSNCEFVLRGGCCMMLYFQKGFGRLSDDVDIICKKGTKVEKYLTQYADYGFTGYHEKHCFRLDNGFYIKRIELFFQSAYLKTQDEPSSIDLDICYDEELYGNAQQTELKSFLTENEGEKAFIQSISIADFLAEKLASFSNKYTNPPKAIHHLHDVCKLADAIGNLDAASATFSKINCFQVKNDALYLNDPDEIFNRIRFVAYVISSRGKVCQNWYALLQEGLDDFASVIYGDAYTTENAIADAVKAAYLATCIQFKAHAMTHYDGNPANIAGQHIGDVMPSELNELRDSNPEAFFYWAKCEEIFLQNK